jgi:hypothetical protein
MLGEFTLTFLCPVFWSPGTTLISLIRMTVLSVLVFLDMVWFCEPAEFVWAPNQVCDFAPMICREIPLLLSL